MQKKVARMMFIVGLSFVALVGCQEEEQSSKEKNMVIEAKPQPESGALFSVEEPSPNEDVSEYKDEMQSFDEFLTYVEEKGITNQNDIFGLIEANADASMAISTKERTKIVNEMIVQYRAGRYMDDDVILQNLYQLAMASESYAREYKMQQPTDQKEAIYNTICFNLYRNLKFIYRGIELSDSEVIKANHDGVDQALKLLEQ